MKADRTIRAMTPEERRAKREWRTGACQVPRCTTRAAYLLMETWEDKSGGGEWWQYCCPKHARRFANKHSLELPPVSTPPAAASTIVTTRRQPQPPHSVLQP